ncbi:hypothetical protein B0H13DRAFT_2385076 [Mycena leptocephala]|nr:hypothetical protein B0H13DRAFT_2385076 [Mycena leptocephala]
MPLSLQFTDGGGDAIATAGTAPQPRSDPARVGTAFISPHSRPPAAPLKSPPREKAECPRLPFTAPCSRTPQRVNPTGTIRSDVDGVNSPSWSSIEMTTFSLSRDKATVFFSSFLAQFLVDSTQIRFVLSATYFHARAKLALPSRVLFSGISSSNLWVLHALALTNAQIVAELDWTRKAIQAILDDHFRMIALAMGLITVIWTCTPAGVSFDNFDWMVAGDYRDLAVGYTSADTARRSPYVFSYFIFYFKLTSALQLEAIGKCSKIPPTNMHIESNTHKSFPSPAPLASMASNSKASASVSGTRSSGGSKAWSQQEAAVGSSGLASSELARQRCGDHALQLALLSITHRIPVFCFFHVAAGGIPRPRIHS